MGMPDRYVQQLELPLRTPQVPKEAADCREPAM